MHNATKYGVLLAVLAMFAIPSAGMTQPATGKVSVDLRGGVAIPAGNMDTYTAIGGGAGASALWNWNPNWGFRVDFDWMRLNKGAGAGAPTDSRVRVQVARGNGYAAAQIDRDFASRRLCHPRAGDGEHGQDCEKHTVLRGVMQRFLLRWRAANSRLPDHDVRLIDAYIRRFQRDQNRDRTTACCAGTLPRPGGGRRLLIRRPERPPPPPALRGFRLRSHRPVPTR